MERKGFLRHGELNGDSRESPSVRQPIGASPTCRGRAADGRRRLPHAGPAGSSGSPSAGAHGELPTRTPWSTAVSSCQPTSSGATVEVGLTDPAARASVCRTGGTYESVGRAREGAVLCLVEHRACRRDDWKAAFDLL